MARWRIGRKLGRTLYRDEVFVGCMDTPELAADVVAAMNARRSPEGEGDDGYLVCDRCRRKSWGSKRNQPCLMVQPDGFRCLGHFYDPRGARLSPEGDGAWKESDDGSE